MTVRKEAKILVLDDEELIRNMVHDMIEAVGYRCDVTDRGEEVVSMYASALESGAPYCAVILDLTIPEGMGGVEAAQAILEMDRDARLIVSSGFSGDRVVEHYKDYGFCASVPKPYSMLELKETLDGICGG